MPLSRCKKAFYGKSGPRKLAHILNTYLSQAWINLKKKNWQRRGHFQKID